jgi:hypothetical protein
MMKRSYITSILILIITIASVTGGVIAFMSDMSSTPVNTFDSGTVLINANETLVPSSIILEGMVPGTTQSAIYTVKNIGTTSIYLRGSFTGSWEPITEQNGKHTNTATVTAEYTLPNSEDKGTITKSDTAHYYILPAKPKP